MPNNLLTGEVLCGGERMKAFEWISEGTPRLG
jgi:hypothetical protein